MKTTKIVLSALTVGLTLVFVLPALGADEIDRGFFKWLYSKETERIYKNPISLEKLRKDPKSFLSLHVTLSLRFHRIEHGLTVPEFTPFDDSYLNFSVWDSKAALWEEEVVRDDFPFMFVPKDSPAAQDLVRLREFDVIEVYGRVESLFEDKPWFQVTDIWLRKKSELTTTLFSHIRLVEDMFAKGMYELTVGELNRILNYELSDDLGGMLFKRKGESLLALEKYSEAAVAFEKSNRLRPDDALVYRGWGRALAGVGKYDQSLWALEKSLVYRAKQPDVYAWKGYCRGKMTDQRIQDLSVDKDYLAETRPEDIRRREKKVREEYDPGRLEVTRRMRSRITRKVYEDILASYDLAILDCRKALFVLPSDAFASETLENIRSRRREFIKKYGPKKETPKPAKSASDSD